VGARQAIGELGELNLRRIYKQDYSHADAGTTVHEPPQVSTNFKAHQEGANCDKGLSACGRNDILSLQSCRTLGWVRRAVVAPANYQVLTRYNPNKHPLNYIAIDMLENVVIPHQLMKFGSACGYTLGTAISPI
jgi:hypothetical protein